MLVIPALMPVMAVCGEMVGPMHIFLPEAAVVEVAVLSFSVCFQYRQ